MKIYIPTIELNNIKNKIYDLKEYCIDIDGKLIYELYSVDGGIYYIEDSKIYKKELVGEDKHDMIKGYMISSNPRLKYDLLIDNTKYNNLLVSSQLPMNYILIKSMIYEYKMNKKSSLSLIVEYILSNNNDLEISDYYLSYKEKDLDIKNIFFQEELNMFLSKLN
jgi:hypothetical protein